MVERVRGKATAQPGKAADPTFFRCGRREPESPSGFSRVAHVVPEKIFCWRTSVGESWNRRLGSRGRLEAISRAFLRDAPCSAQPRINQPQVAECDVEHFTGKTRVSCCVMRSFLQQSPAHFFGPPFPKGVGTAACRATLRIIPIENTP